ncbi:MAG TPA: hypothetical protein VF618_24105 [Thermoanaerobaculia bacterium]
MATNTSERESSERESQGRGGSSSRSSGRGSTSLKSAAASAVSADTLMDIVDRLGLIDLVISRMRSKLEDVEFDDLFDDAGEYLRKNPDILVVVLAGITVTAGAIVFLQSRRGEREEEVPERRTAPRGSSGGGRASTATPARRKAS